MAPTLPIQFAGAILQSPLTSVLALDPAHKFHPGVPDMFDTLKVLSSLMDHLPDLLIDRRHPAENKTCQLSIIPGARQGGCYRTQNASKKIGTQA